MQLIYYMQIKKNVNLSRDYAIHEKDGEMSLMYYIVYLSCDIILTA